MKAAVITHADFVLGAETDVRNAQDDLDAAAKLVENTLRDHRLFAEEWKIANAIAKKARALAVAAHDAATDAENQAYELSKQADESLDCARETQDALCGFERRLQVAQARLTATLAAHG